MNSHLTAHIARPLVEMEPMGLSDYLPFGIQHLIGWSAIVWALLVLVPLHVRMVGRTVDWSKREQKPLPIMMSTHNVRHITGALMVIMLIVHLIALLVLQTADNAVNVSPWTFGLQGTRIVFVIYAMAYTIGCEQTLHLWGLLAVLPFHGLTAVGVVLENLSHLVYLGKTILQPCQYGVLSTIVGLEVIGFTLLTCIDIYDLINLLSNRKTYKERIQCAIQCELSATDTLGNYRAVGDIDDDDEEKQDLKKLEYLHDFSSLWSKVYYLWIQPIMSKGNDHFLESEDLGRSAPYDSSRQVTNELEVRWEEARGKNANPNRPPSVLKVVMRNGWQALALSAFCKLTADLLGFVNPLLVGQVISAMVAIQNGDHKTIHPPSGYKVHHDHVAADMTFSDLYQSGYMLAFTMLCAGVLQNTFMQYHHHLVIREGTRQKVGLQNLIYLKTLRLPLYVKGSQFSTGQITNHMSTDVTKIMFFFYFVNYLWASPLQILITVLLLTTRIGKGALFGIAAMLLLTPLQAIIARGMSKIQKKTLEVTDHRLKLTNEILQGIKIVKFQAWEKPLSDNITATRSRELHYLLFNSLLNAVNSFLFQAGPPLMTFLSFAAFVLIDHQPLTPQKAFTALSLFGLLRVPLVALPMMFRTILDANVSAKRVGEFLLAEELDLSVQEAYLNAPVESAGANGSASPSSRYSRQSQSPQHRQQRTGTSIKYDSLNFGWGTTATSVVLRNLQMEIPEGKLTVVSGKVGSGKSSLLYTLLGEMNQFTEDGNLVRDRYLPLKGRRVAYVSQKAWIFNATVRENITYGLPFDHEKYERVLDDSGMRTDLEILSAGDETEIGEKGINLSGGQKSRIAVARALYFDAEVYLFDDILSALDAHVGKHIFQEAVLGLIRKHKTVVLATHQTWCIPSAQYVIHLSKKTTHFTGSLKELFDQCGGKFAQYLGLKESDRSSADELSGDENSGIIDGDEILGEFPDDEQEDHNEDNEQHMNMDSIASTRLSGYRSERVVRRSRRNTMREIQRMRRKSEGDLLGKDGAGQIHEDAADRKRRKETGKLVDEEERATGAVSLAVYYNYAQAVGISLAILTLLNYILTRSMQVATDTWLSMWSSAGKDADVWYYLKGYAALTGISLSLTLTQALLAAAVTQVGSRRLHKWMLETVVRAPMSFFNSTPTGRILNRFSSDMNTVDQRLVGNMGQLFSLLLQITASIMLQVVVSPWFVVPVVPLGVLYYFVQNYFRAAAREMQRIDSITRSPIYAHLSETLDGLASIRAYGQVAMARENFENKCDTNIVAYNFLNAANRWLGVRLDCLGSLITFGAATAMIIDAKAIPSGQAGLALSYILSVTGILNWLVRALADTEMNLNSVERINFYTKHLEMEEADEDAEVVPPEDWPSRGEITFTDASFTYKKELPPAVKDLSVTFEEGERVGICGRTGSGKSTITLALYRMLYKIRGSVYIDGIDTASVSLTTLRSRMAIIPQDPVLFLGTIRYNLDPVDQYSDADLWGALELAQLTKVVQELDGGLSAEIAEDGDNFSQGQKQLFCLARAILNKKAKILVMDEATASVDSQTDEEIQRIVRSAFQGYTVVTIAHRLNTIMDYGKILVMDSGKRMEFDSPTNLLNDESTIFSSLVQTQL
eukprot:Clim_evm26s239 gene=Clim_evmTU26s239